MKRTETTLTTHIQTLLTVHALPVLWAALIFTLSAQSVLQGFELDTADFVFKKLAHMFVYGVLYFLLYRSVHTAFPKHPATLHWLLPVVLCFLYAISDELHQTFVPGRTGTFRDLGYDMIGVGIAFLWQHRYI